MDFLKPIPELALQKIKLLSAQHLHLVPHTDRSIKGVSHECEKKGCDHITTKNIRDLGHCNVPGAVRQAADSQEPHLSHLTNTGESEESPYQLCDLVLCVLCCSLDSQYRLDIAVGALRLHLRFKECNHQNVIVACRTIEGSLYAVTWVPQAGRAPTSRNGGLHHYR